MLLWPLSEATFVTPWRLLPASPFAQPLLSPRGLILLFVEAVVFAPLLLYACWLRRPPGARSTERPTG